MLRDCLKGLAIGCALGLAAPHIGAWLPAHREAVAITVSAILFVPIVIGIGAWALSRIKTNNAQRVSDGQWQRMSEEAR